MRVPAKLAIGVAALAIGLGGCGEDEQAREDFAQALSAEQIAQFDSAVIDAQLQFDGASSFDASLGGPVSEDGADLTLRVNGDDFGEALEVEASLTYVDGQAYVGFEGRDYAIPPALINSYVRLNEQITGRAETGSFTENCRQTVEQAGGDASVCDEFDLGSWLTDVSDEGVADIGGVSSRHLAADIDVAEVIADSYMIGTAANPAVAQSGISGEDVADRFDQFVDQAEIDLFTGEEDGLLRQLGLEVGIDPPEDEAPIDLEASLTLTEVNEEPEIEAPAGPLVPLRQLLRSLPPEVAALLRCVGVSQNERQFNACIAGIGGQLIAPPTIPG